MNHLQALANFAVNTPGGDIPPAALARANMALTDLLGVTLAGTLEPVSKLIAQHVTQSSRGYATLITGGAKVSADHAALANATAGHALDFDDSNFVLGGHPTVTLLPALLAVGEELHCTGRDILEAYVIGFEITMKFSRAVNYEHYEKGWHPTATLGVFGATAGVARLMHLNAEQTAHALALAASMASGVKANFGSMAKPLQVGYASQKGVQCAQLAAAGMTANPAALDGRQGFLNVYNGEGKYRAEELSALGGELEILRSGLMFKKYACCGATHAPIDAALELKRAHALHAQDIDTVTMAMNARRVTHVNRPKANNGLEGKFSIQYTLAAALADGKVSLSHFNDATVARADLQDLAGRVRVVGVEGQQSLSQQCEITVKMKDGATHSVRREDAEGRAADDFKPYLQPKFMDCATQVFGEAAATPLFLKVNAFADCKDAAMFVPHFVCASA